jgi:hypothetical protein
VRTATITALLIEAARTSETSVYFNETTLHYIPEGCNLHTRRHDKLKTHSSKLHYYNENTRK